MTSNYASWYFTYSGTSNCSSTTTYRAPCHIIQNKPLCLHKEDEEQNTEIDNPSEGLDDLLGFGG